MHPMFLILSQFSSLLDSPNFIQKMSLKSASLDSLQSFLLQSLSFGRKAAFFEFLCRPTKTRFIAILWLIFKILLSVHIFINFVRLAFLYNQISFLLFKSSSKHFCSIHGTMYSFTIVIEDTVCRKSALFSFAEVSEHPVEPRDDEVEWMKRILGCCVEPNNPEDHFEDTYQYSGLH